MVSIYKATTVINFFYFRLKVYVSDFGEERLKEEEVSGPRELKEIPKQNDAESEEDDDEENTEVFY